MRASIESIYEVIGDGQRKLGLSQSGTHLNFGHFQTIFSRVQVLFNIKTHPCRNLAFPKKIRLESRAPVTKEIFRRVDRSSFLACGNRRPPPPAASALTLPNLPMLFGNTDLEFKPFGMHFHLFTSTKALAWAQRETRDTASPHSRSHRRG